MERRNSLFNRRQFLKTSAGAATLLGGQTARLRLLRKPGLPEVRSAAAALYERRPAARGIGQQTLHNSRSDSLHHERRQVQWIQLHPALKPTHLLAYFQGVRASARHLGMSLVNQMNAATQITFINQLPATISSPSTPAGRSTTYWTCRAPWPPTCTALSNRGSATAVRTTGLARLPRGPVSRTTSRWFRAPTQSGRTPRPLG